MHKGHVSHFRLGDERTAGLRYFALVALAVLLLGACSTAAAPTATPSPSSAAWPLATDAPTLTRITPTPRATRTLTKIPPTATGTPADISPTPRSTATASPQPTADAQAWLDVRADDWVRGPDDALVTLVEYADFQCPSCKAVIPWLTRLEDEHAENVRIVFRHRPLNGIHDKAQLAAEAAEAAGAQGAFWEMHDRLFEKQREWSVVNATRAQELFIGYAADLGLDTERFATDLENGVYEDKVQAGYQEATEHEVPGTPAFFINRQPFQAPLSYFWLDAFVQLELLAPRQYDAPPRMTIDPQKQYRATIKTEKGDIVLELDAENAPVTVNNFRFLAQAGWYDGVTFFNVRPGLVAQTGDPTNTGLGDPGYELPPEIGLPHTTGAIAMARLSDEVNPERLSSGSQFYVALEALPQLDGAYTVFGYVIEGMDVVRAITARDPSLNPDLPPGDEIITIEIEALSKEKWSTYSVTP